LAVGREIEVNRRRSNGIGEAADITVYALAEHDAVEQVVCVPIEVKGCWHEEWLSAMDCQLWQRYMKPFGLTHGIYVVGRFESMRWDDQDWRAGACRRRSLDEMGRALDEKAFALHAAERAAISPIVLDLSLAYC
jgi:hypothetical protein